eukprot:TRINITY_DN56333_c0_g1_i1.p1 TRINITY_DN56333_c0_g1~~TRINITY_DN56333_c0_g1_i1.p1  ORF type:complete len:209 (+),score=49.91 TRINITY_DN56333_c0_g1_i1:164-790(+)
MAYAKKSPARQLVGFGLVVAIHVLLIWAVKGGLANSIVELVNGPMETKLIEEKVAEKEAPPPPKVDMKPLPPPVVIPVDISVEAPPSNDAPAIDPNAQRRAAPTQTAAKSADVTVPPRSNPRRPVTQPEYPPTSKRLGEAGTVIMLLTVNEEGRVTDAKIDTSSGFERLDDAAMKEALKAWRLLPGTVNGKPVAMQYKFKVVFKIEGN